MASFLQKRLFTSSKTRHATESTAATSGATTNLSPFESTANSAGASTNLAEISENLDQLLANIGQDERLKIGQENIANRLWNICETYEESKIPEIAASWSCDDPTFQLISLAAQCSEAVYNRKEAAEQGPKTHYQDLFEDIQSIPASSDGSIRATLTQSHMDTKTLVIAFRGTKATSPIDWVTNTNGDAVDAHEFLTGLPNVKAHNGFLYVARNMAPVVNAAISSRIEQADRVLLTGHSAGGAVAALLFAHLKLSNAFPSATIHCITFGAPPVMLPQVISMAIQSPSSIFVSFVTKGDPVPRADKPYIRRLLEIYVRPRPHERITFSPAELLNCGSVIMLHDRNPDSEDADIDVVDVTDSIGLMLFGNVKAHNMKQYLTMLQFWDEKRKSEG